MMENVNDTGTGHPSGSNITELLSRAGAGDRVALDRMLPLVYAELRRMAQGQLRRERQGHTLGVSGLVNEVYLKLVDQSRFDFRGREHFYAIAARAMRQILVDYARRRNAEKRGAGKDHTDLEGKQIGIDAPLDSILALDQALDRMDKMDTRLRQVVEYRYFCGLTEQETADVLGVTVRTVQREWVKARAWLYSELYRGQVKSEQ
jgi:RNA polymerase sigma factor (TIGR02999 family)